MELKQLRAFVTLAEELHFGRAAQRLFIVQPALSMQIKALEQALGARLFERDRHKVELSDAGRVFLPEAQATLQQATHAEQMVRLSSRGEVGTLRIAFVSSVLPALLPAVLRAMHERYPLITLELKDMPTPDQVTELRYRRIDFGMIRLPASYAGINTRVILEEGFVIALPPDHPLAAHGSISPSALRGQPAFVLARRYAPGFHDAMLLALSRAGTTLEIAQEFGEFTTMLALVAAGMGIGLMPAEAASALPPNVLARPLDLAGHRSGIGLAWTDLDSPLKRTFVNVLEHAAIDSR
ncbi:LysR family transcriptional regulator [Burkholderia thailandensis]|uniref:Transcriptional regulator, LysR family n=1 Tax=Burkholderia thailandensis (strain ATCC 700388 / DSM 13276 / CCUG 48851 / CIP 106301 / E264) TaxID=271848 RepID=Q2T8E9_BURTA|nr:LysR family transcriptional regulator [Burkholderia thailandensis]ABC35343.1 transcriptional regulator, LysR family [Burkholderia thailandensis E264]AHI76898.1 bacterial regulatory helix-turn-helix, lysR family protein [Burkholderia thailandensis 2002721723]AHI81426.1 bacterial regulatory helix-turn-helix, lysR family protein [Burkholderia thailandensis E444]AIC89357.1 bacterial regulatory helix-turn-helix, lysR family protein [Burkholderia thailandensis USAMRU Malaysia \